MAQRAPRITTELLNEPHIEGRRVSVLQIHDRVKEFGADPEAVAEEFDLDVADVYYALAYYCEHQDELEAVRKRRERELNEIREEVTERRPDSVSP